MRRLLVSLSLFAAFTVASAAHAQQIVHALTGKVSAIYPNAIKVTTDDGTPSLFDIVKPGAQIDFQKSVKLLTTPAADFKTKDADVIVYYFGDDNIRTTVALQDLGSGAVVKSVGTVVKYDKHAHSLVIKDESGTEKTFATDAKTVGEATSGVVLADKLDLNKGTKVRIAAVTENGVDKAAFIRALSF